MTEPIDRECTHYWLIERAKGPSSRGECKYCHRVQTFGNDPPTQDKTFRSVIKREITRRQVLKRQTVFA